jgi:RimJ/RimL family protein N-acetyltransferase
MELEFRRATVEDIPTIRALADEIWHAYYPGIITVEQIDYMLGLMYSAEALERQLSGEGHVYLLASYGQEPAGFLSYQHEPAQGAMKLARVYLKPAYHGQGFGRRMLEEARRAALALSVQEIYLTVNKQNVKAQRAYERFGFVNAGSVVADIGHGYLMDDYLMRLSL